MAMQIPAELSLKPRSVWWESQGFGGGSVMVKDNQLMVIYQANGLDHRTRLGRLTIKDKGQTDIQPEPILDIDPQQPREALGLSSPQLVQFDRDLVVIYTVTATKPPTGPEETVPWQQRLGLATSRDGQQWQRQRPWPEKLDCHHPTLFPEPVSGRYGLIYSFDRAIYLTWAHRLGDWTSGMEILSPVHSWEQPGVIMTAPPVRTNRGWLYFYQSTRPDQTTTGLALGQLTNPGHLVSRRSQPVSIDQLRLSKRTVSDKLTSVVGLIQLADQIWLLGTTNHHTLRLIKTSLDTILELLPLHA